MRFEGRDLKNCAEPVLPDRLQEGKAYFAVIFWDQDGLVPSMEPRVFVGTKSEPEGDRLYFQDLSPTNTAFRFGSPNADEEATFVTGAGRFIFEYERALEVLMPVL
jgi:hypothetical protein